MPKEKKEKTAAKEKKPQDVNVAQNNRVAVIATGGKQYKVQPGRVIKVEKIAAKTGEKVAFPDLLTKAKVTTEVVAAKLGPKVSGIKFHKRKRYLHRLGHRQWQTILRIIKIE